MKQENCVFCKIINHEIPSAKVYEDENILAFLDISQVTEGHTLVIPKKHCKDIFELDEQTLAQVFQAVKKIAGKMQENLEVDGINLVNNNGKNAGQEVFHYHVHLIPRYGKGDGYLAVWKTNSSKYTPGILQRIAEKINNEMQK